MTVATIAPNKNTRKQERVRLDLARAQEDLARLSDDATRQAVDFLKLLADETRLRIVYVLKHRGELNVQTMCRVLKLTQPAVSHHLALLRVAGLLALRREGKHNYYHLVPDRFVEQLGILDNFLPTPAP